MSTSITSPAGSGRTFISTDDGTPISITATGIPTSPKDIATKEYVDSKTTISTLAPSGGNPGDVWYVVED